MTGGAAKRVIIVDDDAGARRMLRRVLERRGYVIDEAGDGRAGLDSIRDERPDAVLLDLRMPGGMSGLDVAVELRADPATADLPIVVVSASVHGDAQGLVLEAGCNAFLEKPVDFDELCTVLDSLTHSA